MRLARLLTPVFALTLAFPLAGCLGNDVTEPPPAATATVETTTFAPSLGIDLSAPGWTRTTNGVYYRILTAGADTAAVVASGQRISVRYTLWLSSGQQLQTGPFTFTLGSGDAISGLNQGLVGARVGETRRLLIPPALAYGAGGFGQVPGNAVIVFNIELLSVG